MKFDERIEAELNQLNEIVATLGAVAMGAAAAYLGVQVGKAAGKVVGKVKKHVRMHNNPDSLETMIHKAKKRGAKVEVNTGQYRSLPANATNAERIKDRQEHTKLYEKKLKDLKKEFDSKIKNARNDKSAAEHKAEFNRLNSRWKGYIADNKESIKRWESQKKK